MLVDALEESVEVLDRIDDSVIIVCALSLDERPPRGLSSFVDWRAGGALARAFEADDGLGRLGVVRPFESPHLGGARVYTVGHGSRLDEAGLRMVAAHLDDEFATIDARPYRVFASWPERLPQEEPLAEIWLAPFLARLASSRLCLVGSAAELEPVHRLLLRAERRLLGKSEPFSFPLSFATGDA